MEFIDLKTQYQQIKANILKNINTVLEHGKYIMGPEISELEQKLCEYVGAKHCIAVSSGTDALLISLMSLEIASGDEIITTPFSFIATSETIKLLGATPVYVDICRDTYNLDPSQLETAISEKTKAIIPVSLYGQPANFSIINTIADKHDIAVIEDAAQSLGSTHNKLKSCNLSIIACTSFFPCKPLGGYGDGGAIFTNNDELATKLRQIRIHGQDKRYHHCRIGINGRMDTLQAAILLAKLPIFDKEIKSRQTVAARYDQAFNNMKIKHQYIEPENTCVYAQYTIEVNNRDKVREHLSARGIPSAVHYPIPLYQQPACRQYDLHLINTEEASNRVLSLPMHPYLGSDEQDKIISVLLDATKTTK